MNENTDEDFIRTFVKYNEGTEVPDIFALWCAVGGISCALGRRVTLDMGHYSVFPNFYIVLVAGSGQCRKSTAIKQIEGIIRQLDPVPNLISQKVTPEALIKAIRTEPPVDENSPKINLKEECVGFAIVDELATFLNKNVYDTGLGSLLTPFWDCNDTFEYRTLARGAEELKNLCFGILGASTVDWLQSAIPVEAVGGGVTSRIIFVYVEDPPPPVARTPKTEAKKALYEKLIRGLRRISTYTGEVKLTEDCWDVYEKEYNLFYLNNSFKNDKTLAGYASRRHIHLLKLALMFSVSEGPSLVVQTRHFQAAKMMLENSEQHMPLVLSLITSSTAGMNLAKVFSTIRRYGVEGVSRTILLRMFSHQMTSRELSELLETLVHSRRIDCSTNGTEVRYFVLKERT